MSTEKQPLLVDLEKAEVPNLVTPGSNLHIAAEVSLPPYYEDGHVRYYATKTWENVIAGISFVVCYGPVNHFVKCIPLSCLSFFVLVAINFYIVIPLALLTAAIVSGRRRSICQWFYQIYYRQLPQKVNTYLAKYILAGV